MAHKGHNSKTQFFVYFISVKTVGEGTSNMVVKGRSQQNIVPQLKASEGKEVVHLNSRFREICCGLFKQLRWKSIFQPFCSCELPTGYGSWRLLILRVKFFGKENHHRKKNLLGAL